MTAVMIDICICSFNPRLDILQAVLQSIAAQTAAVSTFQLYLIDNASQPALEESLLQPIVEVGISARLLREPKAGLTRARLLAIQSTSADWILWVDDDNVLDKDFVKNAIEFIANNPNVGCFGGRLNLPEGTVVQPWATPFLPYFAIIDRGAEVIIETVDKWTIAEPPGGGAVVHRRVLNRYQNLLTQNSDAFTLGRKGKWGLSNCDDSLMMRGAYRENLACAYVPTLTITHHINVAKRLKMSYLLRFLFSLGRSHVVLECVLDDKQSILRTDEPKRNYEKFLREDYEKAKAISQQFAWGLVAYHYGAIYELWRRRRCLNKTASPRT